MAEKPLTTIAEFLLDTPFYTGVTVTTDNQKELIDALFEGGVFDGHCPFCHSNSTFKLPWETNAQRILFDMHQEGKLLRRTFVCTCARDKDHNLQFVVFMNDWTLIKMGQWPSLAAIANDESRQYRLVLSATDSDELHKAIELAAHGVGIGSFVYLRRIFERLIWQRFDEFKQAEGWSEKDFQALRMDEKIGFLKGHLPAFLVENKGVYSILSTGLHELTEAECLQDFDVVKGAIIMILDEDRRKKETLAKQQKLSASIHERMAQLAAKSKPEEPKTKGNRMLPKT